MGWIAIFDFMTTKILTVLFFCISLNLLGQQVAMDTFKIKGSDRFSEIFQDSMNFPLISTGNKNVDSLINFDLKNRLTTYEFPAESIDSTLIKWAGNGLVYMDFEVTYNANNLLSLQISAEGCGAYCTSWTEYFNYNTLTGSWVELQDILKIGNGFESRVLEEKSVQYEGLREDLKIQTQDLDQDLYETILEYYDECDSAFTLDKFILFPDSIQIIERCWMPHFLLPYTAIIELKYAWADLEKELNSNYSFLAK